MLWGEWFGVMWFCINILLCGDWLGEMSVIMRLLCGEWSENIMLLYGEWLGLDVRLVVVILFLDEGVWYTFEVFFRRWSESVRDCRFFFFWDRRRVINIILLWMLGYKFVRRKEKLFFNCFKILFWCFKLRFKICDVKIFSEFSK